MTLLDTIDTGNVILIAYTKECEEYLFSQLDNLFNISYIDYKNQIFKEEDFIIDEVSYMRDTKISLILSIENPKGYNIVNLNNFEISHLSAPNKLRHLIRSVSSKGYLWSNDNLKIRTIFLSQSYMGLDNNLIVRGGSHAVYSCDLVISIKDPNTFEILKNLNSYSTTEVEDVNIIPVDYPTESNKGNKNILD